MIQTPHVIGYARVSTDAQDDSGLSHEAQEAMIRAYAAKKSLPVRDVKCDAVSGGAELKDRPGLIHAIQLLRIGDVLVVDKRDRMARDVIEAAVIERDIYRRKATLVSLAGEGTGDDSPQGKMFRRMLDVIAEYEREMGQVRTKAAKRAARARGDHIGGLPPYGYRKVKTGTRDNGKPILKLEPVESEQAVIARAKELAENQSWTKVASALMAEGKKPRKGRQWHRTQLQRMCR